MGEAKPEACSVEFREDPIKGWKVVLNRLSPACKASLERISRELGPHARKYLAKRIEAGSPEVEEFLKSIGLTPS